MAEQVAGRERVIEDDPAVGASSRLDVTVERRQEVALQRRRVDARVGAVVDPRRQVLDAGVAVDAEVLERDTDREQDDRGGDVRERDLSAAPARAARR